jgi:transcriptional regulator GlxA family with amidase domain
MPARAVLILLFSGVQSLDVTGPLEVFTGAARYRGGGGTAAGPDGQADGQAGDQPGGRADGQAGGQPRPAYQVSTASLGGRPVSTSSGLTLVPDADLAAIAGREVHTLIVPGGDGTASPDPELIGWLRAHAPAAQRIASVCTGAFLLAAAGLLSGKRATTHWAYSDALARSYPDVQVDPEPIYIRDGAVATSAGVTAGVDLSLALVEEDIGRDAALAVARHLVVFLRRPGGQAQFSAQLRAQVAQRAPLREIQHWITERPAADLSVPTLAARAGLSARQFARTFAAQTGVPPGRYVDRVRLEAARRRLEDTGDGIEQIARSCGYGTPEAMRRAFVRTLGVSPAGYRHRF